MTAKESYARYIADDTFSTLSAHLMKEILNHTPNTALDFGMGSGKHAHFLRGCGIETFGIDVSMMNVVRAYAKYELPLVACADENLLRFIRSVDVVFTCSVLDHIENIDGIMNEFKRIGKTIVIAETNDTPGEFYYPHDYESYGFKKTDFRYQSEPPNGDGATYHIWKWQKGINEVNHINDDLGCAAY